MSVLGDGPSDFLGEILVVDDSQSPSHRENHSEVADVDAFLAAGLAEAEK